MIDAMRSFGEEQLAKQPLEVIEAAKRIYPRCLIRSDHYVKKYLLFQAPSLPILVKAHEARDWKQYVTFHHDGYKVYALLEAARLGLAGPEYWQLMRDTWQMLHRVYDNNIEWMKLFKRRTHGRLESMSTTERAVFDGLLDQVTVHRGARPDEIEGIAWTLDQGVAQFFADRHPDGAVYEVTVPKKQVLMYLADREEAEVIVQLTHKDLPSRKEEPA